jgi:hypothetical protein
MEGASQLVGYSDRRSGIDRRNFSYTGHVPERRAGNNRRALQDRRVNKNFTIFDGEERRTSIQP